MLFKWKHHIYPSFQFGFHNFRICENSDKGFVEIYLSFANRINKQGFKSSG